MTIDEATVEAALEARGFDTETVGTFRNGDAVFVATRDGDGERVVKFLDRRTVAEPFVLREVNEATDLPVPTVHDVEVPGPAEAAGVFTMERRPGEPVRKARDLDLEPFEAAVFDVGRTLARLHDAVQFDRHGQFRVVDGKLQPADRDDWPAVFFDTIAANLLDALADSRFDSCVSQLRSILREGEHAVPERPAPALLHSGIRWDHLLFPGDEWAASGVLSWGLASVGHRELDLVQSAYWLIDQHVPNPRKRDRLHESLYEGYSTAAADWRRGDGFERRRRVYRAVAIAKTMGHFDEWAGSLNPLWRRMVAKRYRKDLRALLD